MPKPRIRIASQAKVLYIGPIPVPRAVGDSFVFRVEILRDLSTPRRYIAKVWRIEHYRVEPSFPRRKGRQPSLADEGLLVEDVMVDTGAVGRSAAEAERRVLARMSEVFGTG